MASYFGINGDSSSFFSSYFGSTNTTSTGSDTSLSDYAMIKSGAYKKLMKAYYNKDASSEETSTKSDADSTSKVALTQAKTSASELKKASETLKETDASNQTALVKNVQGFVDAYNDMIDHADDVDNKTILHKTLWMIGNTNVSSDLLDEVGITVGADNKLTLDTDQLKTADTSTVKTLFSGTGSFVSNVAGKANDILNLSTQALKTLGKAGSAYTSTGDYSTVNTSTIFDQLK